MDLDNFRAEAREWLAENCPEGMRNRLVHFEDAYEIYQSDDAKLWLERAVERGWTAPMWPKEYGGGGLSYEENLPTWVLSADGGEPFLQRVRVTGCRGQLGAALVEALAARGIETQPLDHAALDIADADAVRRSLAQHPPDVWINAAAFTHVDRCEREPEAARRGNATAPAVLARACAAALRMRAQCCEIYRRAQRRVNS